MSTPTPAADREAVTKIVTDFFHQNEWDADVLVEAILAWMQEQGFQRGTEGGEKRSEYVCPVHCPFGIYAEELCCEAATWITPPLARRTESAAPPPIFRAVKCSHNQKAVNCNCADVVECSRCQATMLRRFADGHICPPAPSPVAPEEAMHNPSPSTDAPQRETVPVWKLDSIYTEALGMHIHREPEWHERHYAGLRAVFDFAVGEHRITSGYLDARSDAERATEPATVMTVFPVLSDLARYKSK